MNKELIKTYKAEFDHWLNGGTLLYRCFNYIEQEFTAWEKCNAGFSWNTSGIHTPCIIINDEYVEFRKALAEGKTVQYNFGNHGINKRDFLNKWKDLDISIGILADRACPENYRIKPEEPKFKVGDWVVNKTSKQRIVKKITSTYSDTVTVGDSEVGTNVMLINDLELWKPKKGEYCWFWNKGATITILELLEIVEDGNRKYFAAMPNIPHSLGGYYQYCEPFFGTLPTELRN